MISHRIGTAVLFSVIIFAAGPPAHAVTWHVDVDAPPGGSGTGWEDPFNDLQDALAAAQEDNRIKVAQGTYKPGDERADSFVLKDGVLLEGGYVGYDEPDPNLRDVKAYETILSGDIDDNGMEDCYHVVSASEVDVETVLDGFTVTHGVADLVGQDEDGAGMNLFKSSPLIKNCLITVSDAEGYGGGICVVWGAPALVKCALRRNKARHGGGALYALLNDGANMNIVNCEFQGNEVSVSELAGGGAVHLADQSFEIVNTVFAGNSAWRGGAVYVNNDWYGTAAVGLINATLAGNHAQFRGGGLYCCYESETTVQNCVLWDNTKAESGTVEPCQISDFYGTCQVYDTIIQGGWTGTGSHNSSDDPEFVNGDGADDMYGTADDNLRLKIESPGIDWGDQTEVPADSYDVDDDGHESEKTPDLDLEDRVHEDDVDTGAYEFWCYADATHDGIIDVLDLLAVLAAWGPCPGCDEDVNGDDVVDVLDLLAVLSQWGCGLPPAQRQPAPEGIDDCIDRYGDNIERLTACIETIIITQGGE